jgi:hypothetical protein
MTRRWCVVILFAIAALGDLGAQSEAPLGAVSIVLPPRLLANAPATLAILGADGHLAPGVVVDIGNGQHGTTDATGRLSFTAPPNGAFIASASGVSAAALVDESEQKRTALIVAPAVSQRDRFAICGGGFRGELAANTVTINGDAAFVLASSPVCLVVLAQSRTMAGHAKIDIDAAGKLSATSTALIAVDFIPPNPPWEPGRNGRFLVRADGTSQPLYLIVENRSPEVLHFMRGDTQEVRTSGGAENEVAMEARALRSGKFSLHARIGSPPDAAGAARFAEIAAGITAKNPGDKLKSIAADLEKHPREAAGPRAALDRLANTALPGTLRVLIDAARDSLDSRVADQ